ncbi:olfactory receptor 1509-like [Rhinatrema bivittatum]|uniref:olfactory receptor 1509-like n=1 Tax=Rhinatrema bivittatum TaxID=194408 RepID=UPI0011275414|nr:olfactory receptor 1509-like [Rhinatrema bivittatum]
MAVRNESGVTQFILLGLSNTPELQILFFVVFLIVYLFTIAGNVLIMVTIYMHSNLHSPMYFFLSHLSFLDLCHSTVTIPKALVNSLSQSKTISFNECMAQLFFFHFIAGGECFHLSLMAYDRYVAIRNPLRYITIMSGRACLYLVFSTWVGGFVHSLTQTLLTLQLPFCGPNEINHFFCDVHPLSLLACSSIDFNEAVAMANNGSVVLFCFLVVFISYMYIISTVLQIRSAEGRQKAFSTCASHLLVVTLFFGPGIFVYIRSSVTFSADKMVSVFYTFLTPLLNPLIYTLRNEEVKKAMRRLRGRKVSGKEILIN